MNCQPRARRVSLTCASPLQRAATAHAGMASRSRSTNRLHSPSTSERPLSRQSRSFRARAKPDLAVDITDVPPMVPPGSKAGLAALKRKKSMRASREAARVERAAMEQRYGHKAGHSVSSVVTDSVFVVHPNGDTTYLRSPSSHAGTSPAAVGTVRDDAWGDDDVLGPTVEATVPSPGAFRASTTGNELTGAAHTSQRPSSRRQQHNGAHDASDASEPVPLAANVSMKQQPVLVPSPVVTNFHPPREGGPSTFPAAMSPWSASSRGTRSPAGGRSPVVPGYHGDGGWSDAVPHSPSEHASWFTLQGHTVAPDDEVLRSPHSRGGALSDTRASAVRQSSPMVVPRDAALYRRKTPGSSPVAVPAVVGASVSPPVATNGVSMLRSPLSMPSPDRPQSANPSSSGGVRTTALTRPRTAGAGTSRGGLRRDTTGRPSTASSRSALLAPMTTATAQHNMVVAPNHPRRMLRGFDEGLVCAVSRNCVQLCMLVRLCGRRLTIASTGRGSLHQQSSSGRSAAPCVVEFPYFPCSFLIPSVQYKPCTIDIVCVSQQTNIFTWNNHKPLPHYCSLRYRSATPLR